MFCAYCRLPMDRSLLKRSFRLTPREAEIVLLATRGRSSKQIAHDLDLSIHTIGVHLQSAYRKCGVHDRAGLLLYVLREHFPGLKAGWIAP